MSQKPNVVFAFADQLRAQALGYAGDPNAHTPNIDRLASQSINVTHATSGCPVCCPYRGSLMTGQYPLTHGVYINDVPLGTQTNPIAVQYTQAGYNTAYIGKWHLYGSPDGKFGRRRAFVPREHRQGWSFWKAFECNHDYNKSPYFEGDDPTERWWEGYDALAQTRDACDYIAEHAGDEQPFFLMLSWGTPHNPYETAPEQYTSLYDNRELILEVNVPEEYAAEARRDLKGYYAHIAALDDCVGMLMDTLEQAGIADDTIVVFTSDHGDMLRSQGVVRKINPWAESLNVPFLMRYPEKLGADGREVPALLDAPDIMPTLLDLCDIPIPETVEGTSYAPYLTGDEPLPDNDAAFLQVPVSFAIQRAQGLPEYRGIRTRRYTYARSILGPWLLYDNKQDPLQLHNLIGDPSYTDIQAHLESHLQALLKQHGDKFLPGNAYLERDNRTHYDEVSPERWHTIDTPWSLDQEP